MSQSASECCSTANGTNEIDLGWTPGSTDTGGPVDQYIIENSTDNTTFSYVAQVLGTATTYQDMSVNDGTKYYYRVTAANAVGNSDATDPAYATTALLPPTDLAATPVSSTENDLAWTNPSQAATGFTIQRRTGTDAFTTIGTISASSGQPPATTYADHTAVPGTLYDYQVLATVGSAVPAAAGTSALTLPDKLSSLTATADSSSQVTLGWTPTLSVTTAAVAITPPWTSGLTLYPGDTLNVSIDSNDTHNPTESLDFGDGTVVDAQTDPTNTSQWSDPSGIGIEHFTSSHAFADPGQYTANFTVTPAAGDGSALTYSFTVNVLSTIGLTVPGITATTGIPFAGVVATFPDNGTTHAGTTSAQIAWGDGNTTDGTLVAGANGQWNVLGMHSYSTEGANSILVTVRGITSADATAAGTATVVPPPTVAVGGGATAVLSSDSTYVTLNVFCAEGDESESGLTYTWTQTGGPSGASAAVFSDNGTNSAKNQPVYLSQAGTYTFMATIANAAGTTITSSAAAVHVAQIATSITTTPASAVIGANGTQTFSGTEVDQFGNPMTTQPELLWNVESGGEGGTIDSTAGIYTAGAPYGSDTIDVTDQNDTSVTGQAGVYDVTAAPAQPTGLTAAAAETAVLLSWDPQQDAATYNLYMGTSPGGESSTPIAQGLTDPSYTATNLTDGTPYYFFVKAINPIGTSAACDEAHATPAPVAVTGLTATPGDGVVNVSWDPALGALSYNLYEGSTAGGEGTTPYQTGIIGTSFTDPNTSSTMTNYYLAQPVYPSGPGELDPSDETPGVQGEFAAPSAPTGLTATANGTNEIDLGWTASSTDTGGPVDQYIIENSTDNTTFSYVTQAPGTATTYQDMSVNDGTKYYYRVTAANAVGNSDASNVPNATTSLLPPTNLSATPVSSTENDLSWSNPSQAADGFTISRRTTGSGDFTTIGTISASSGQPPAATFADQHAVAGTTYDYQVSATVGSVAPAAAQTTIQTIPDKLSGLSANADSSSQVTLGWTPVNGASGYEIDRKVGTGDWEIYDSLDDGTATGYVDTPVSDGTTYTYRVLPYNGSGTSDASSAPTAPATTPLIAPVNVNVVALSPTSVEVVWENRSSSETGFSVQRLYNGSPNGEPAPVDAGTTYYVDDLGVLPSTSYTYNVSATKGAAASPETESATVTTPAAVPTLSGNFTFSSSTPPTPEFGGSSEILLTYSGPAGANLELEEIAPGFDNYQVVPSAPNDGTGSTPYSVPDILAGDTYTFRLRADLNGQVIYSNPFPTVTTPSAPSGPNVPATPTIGNMTTDPETGLIDLTVSDSDTRVAYVTAGFFVASDPYQYETVTGSAGAGRGSDGNFTIVLTPGETQGLGILKVIANPLGTPSAPAMESVADIPHVDNALPAVSPTLTVTPASNGQLTVSWTGALTESDCAGTAAPGAWNDTQLEFGAPDGHSPDSALDAGGDPVLTPWPYDNPDGTGSVVIDPTQPYANGQGDYVYVEGAGGYVSNIKQISPYLSPPAAPQSLQTTPFHDTSGSGVRLIWDNTSNNEMGFAIQRRVHGTSSWTDVDTVGGNVTNYVDTSADPTVTYDYQVGAIPGSGVATQAVYGNPVTTTPLAIPTVSVTALLPNAVFAGPDGKPQAGYLDFHRTGDTDYQLMANVSTTGTTAVAGQDYSGTLPTTVNFPAGQQDVIVPIVPANGAPGATSLVLAQVTTSSYYDAASTPAQVMLGIHGLGVTLGNGTTDDMMLGSQNGTQNLQPLTFTVPADAAPGTIFTLSINTDKNSNAASLVDVWNPEHPASPLFGNGTAAYSWTLGSSDTVPPSTLEIGAIATSRILGDLSFDLAEHDPPQGTGFQQPMGGGARTNSGETITAFIVFQQKNIANNASAPVPVVVGEKISLTSTAVPLSLTHGATYNWSIDGSAIGGYQQEIQSAVVTPLGGNPASQLDRSNPTFYWVQPSDAGVPLRALETVTLDPGAATEIQFPATAYFNVETPSGSLSGITTANVPPVSVGPYTGAIGKGTMGEEDALHFGDSFSNDVSAGIRMNAVVATTATHDLIPAAAGRVEIVQLVNLRQTLSTHATTRYSSTDGAYVLDYSPLFGGVAPVGEVDEGGFAVVPYGTGGDSPGVGLGPLNYVDRQDQFVDFLMYQPTGGVWVTLRKLTWSWGAVAFFDLYHGGVWRVLSPHSSNNPTSIASNHQPQWDATAWQALKNPKIFI